MFNTKVKELAKIRSKSVSWNADILLFEIKNGKGIIKKRAYYDYNKYRDSGYDILLGKKVLANVHGNIGSPTCQHLISEGYGFDDSDRILTDLVVSAQNANLSLNESLVKLKPLLSLFSDGLYAISRSECYPTDGEGNFFWTCTNKDRLYKTSGPAIISSSHFDYSRYGFSPPHFLYPSQSLSKLNTSTVDKYVDKIDSGETLTGLALGLAGSLSLLLDGHHRATASCLKQKSIDMLIIFNLSYSVASDTNECKVCIGSDWFGQSNLDGYSRIKNYCVNEIHRKRNDKHNNNAIDNTNNISNKIIDSNLGKSLDKISLKYPVYEELSFFDSCEDRTFDRLEFLWDKSNADSRFEFYILFNYLYKHKKEECFSYLVKAINDKTKVKYMDIYFKKILTYDYSKIENILVDFLVNIYNKEYVTIEEETVKKLIDKYYQENEV